MRENTTISALNLVHIIMLIHIASLRTNTVYARICNVYFSSYFDHLQKLSYVAGHINNLNKIMQGTGSILVLK